MPAKASSTNPPKSAGLANTSRTVKKGKGVTPVDNLPTYVVASGEIIAGEGGADGGGGSTTASTVRVTIADDDALVLAIKAALEAIDDWDSNDRAKVSPIPGVDGVAAGAGAVGTSVQRVTLASDDPSVALLTTIDGTLTTISGALTSILAELEAHTALLTDIEANTAGP